MKKNLHILMVEDNPADAFRVVHQLRKGGLDFRSDRVESREEFLRILQEDPPDLILSDHGLPSFDGFTALDIVRKQQRRIPFIFVTGSNDQALMVEMFEAGASGYVYKNQIADLIPAVQQALTEADLQKKPDPCAPGRTEPSPALPSPTGKAATPALPAIAAVKLPQQFLCPDCKTVHDGQDQRTELRQFYETHPEAALALMLCQSCTTNSPFKRLF